MKTIYIVEVVSRSGRPDQSVSHEDLSDADLTATNLEGADLEGANLTDANLAETNLKNVKVDERVAAQIREFKAKQTRQ